MRPVPAEHVMRPVNAGMGYGGCAASLDCSAFSPRPSSANHARHDGSRSEPWRRKQGPWPHDHLTKPRGQAKRDLGNGLREN